MVHIIDWTLVRLQLRACIQPHFSGALRTREPCEHISVNPASAPKRRRGTAPRARGAQRDSSCPKASNGKGFPRTSARCSHCLQLFVLQTPNNFQTQDLKSLFAVQNSPAIPDYETDSKYTNSWFQINASQEPWEQVLGFKWINCTSFGFSLGREATGRTTWAFH